MQTWTFSHCRSGAQSTELNSDFTNSLKRRSYDLYNYVDLLILDILTSDITWPTSRIKKIICWYFVTQVWLRQARGTVKTLIRHSRPGGHVDLLSAHEMLIARETWHHALLFQPLWSMSHATVLAQTLLIWKQSNFKHAAVFLSVISEEECARLFIRFNVQLTFLTVYLSCV